MSVQAKQEKETIEVHILGERYVLRSEATPDYTRKIAEYVDRTAAEIKREGGVLDQKKLAILTALAITDQLFDVRDGMERVRNLVEQRAGRITEEVLAVVGHAPEA